MSFSRIASDLRSHADQLDDLSSKAQDLDCDEAPFDQILRLLGNVMGDLESEIEDAENETDTDTESESEDDSDDIKDPPQGL